MKTMILLSALAMLPIFSAAADKISKPDFRYPENVMKDAEKQIKKASAANDCEAIIDGIIKLSLAKGNISTDFAQPLIETVDSVAQNIADPGSKAIAFSLEADLYRAFFDTDRHEFIKREKAGSNPPADIREWSDENFYDRILDLTDSILSQKEALKEIPIGKYAGIINNTDADPQLMPTLFDLLANDAIGRLEAFTDKFYPWLPYNKLRTADSAKTKIEEIYRLWIPSTGPDSPARIFSEMSYINSCTKGKQKKDTLLKKYEEHAKSPYSIEVLYQLLQERTDSNEETVRLHKMAVAACKRFPEYKRINLLKNWINETEKAELSIRLPEVTGSTDSIAVSIESRNLKKATLKIYKVSENQELKQPKITLQSVLRNLTLARTEEFDLEDSLFRKSKTTKLPPLPTGKYLIVPEYIDPKTGKKIYENYVSGIAILRVTDIAVMMRMEYNGEQRVFAADAQTARPLAKARIHILDYDDKHIKSLSTNVNGYAVISPEIAGKSRRIYAQYGNDRSATVYYWTPGEYLPEQIQGSIYTDRGVYRPGETMEYAAVIYEIGDGTMSLCRDKTALIEFSNANYEVVHTDTLSTDQYGRIYGKFSIPLNGMTGNYTIRVCMYGKSSQQQSFTKRVDVSEYKAPTFFAEYEEERSELNDTSALRLRGKVTTYSGMPVANARIAYSLTGENSWFFKSDFEDLDGTTTTDKNGCWEIYVPSENLSKERSFTITRLQIHATDEKGETQPLTATVAFGKPRIIERTDYKDEIVADRKLNLPVKVTDGKKTVVETVNYAIHTEHFDLVEKGRFSSDKPTVDLSKLPSGKYDIDIWLDNEDDAIDFSFVILRKEDKCPPFATPLWLPEGGKPVECAADGTFSIRFGNSFDNFVYYVVQNNGKATASGWKEQQAGFHTLKAKAEFSAKGHTSVTLYTMHNHQLVSTEITLNPAVPRDSIEILTETFRDNVTPGGKETWKLRIVNNNGKPFTSAVIANMYDAALNAITPNLYSLNAHYAYVSRFRADGFYISVSSSSFLSSPVKWLKIPNVCEIPELNRYGQEFFNSPIRHLTVRGSAGVINRSATNVDYRMFSAAPGIATTESMVEDAAEEILEESVVTELSMKKEAVSAESAAKTTATLRDDGIKTAFFLPGLVTEENGELTISFDVPNRNTQWQFSAVAYTEDLQTAYINKTVTAAKQLMIEPNMPRFAREGDRLTLKATAYNKTETPQTVTVRFEIFDGKHSDVKSFDDITLAPGTGETVGFNYAVPASEGLICKTMILKDGRMADGEQNLLPILPATTEVTEAETFYLNDTEHQRTIDLPEYRKDSRITLEYTDNPIWCAVMALPSVISKDAVASAYIVNYYATTVAESIVRKNPHIAEAIRYWNEKGNPQSALGKNDELKIEDLADTPWSEYARSEEKAIRQLAELIDPATIQYRKQQALIAISDLQKGDGGISWFKDCPSSVFITEQVLERIGNLNEMGCLDSDDAILKRIIRKATEYCDIYYEDLFDRLLSKNKDIYLAATNYVYIRSMLPTVDMPADLQKAKDSIVSHITKKWGSYSVEEKAKAAILLWNSGKTAEARNIVESMRQHARKSPERGWYWDIPFADKAAVAARALKAFHKVNADDSAIDGIRQWLLIQKETRCWETTVATCDAVNALLTTGKDWIGKPDNSPKLEIGGIRIETDDATPYFGYVKRSIDLNKTAGNTLRIIRDSGSPAWGAVYCQYNAPMKEVKKNKTDDLKIEKSFFVYGKDGQLSDKPSETFAIGDRVQVRLTIRTERDLNFVVIKDERAACLEPVDQKSVYDWSRGLGIYRETRDSATNIFIDWMPKGSYIVTYDAYVNNSGHYASGLAALQCQYALQMTAHSEGTTLTIE